MVLALSTAMEGWALGQTRRGRRRTGVPPSAAPAATDSFTPAATDACTPAASDAFTPAASDAFTRTATMVARGRLAAA
jgi:hypothetical protein